MRHSRVRQRKHGGWSSENKEGEPETGSPPSQPTTNVLVVPVFCRAHEAHFRRRRRDTWGRIIGHDLAVRGRDEAHGAFGIVSPAVRIGKFLAAVMQTGDLIFEAGTVALLENRRRHKD